MSANKTESPPAPIDLFGLWSKFLPVLKKIWGIVIVTGIIGGILFFLWGKMGYEPMYEAKAVLSIHSGTGNQADALRLAQSYPELISTHLMRDLIMWDMGVEELNGTITPSVLANMLSLSVRSNSPEDAYQILCSTIDVFPQIAEYMAEDPEILVLEEPRMPSLPCNGFDGWKATAAGIFLGLTAGLAVVFLISLFAPRIYSVDQLKKLTDLPVLAVLPGVCESESMRGLCLRMPEESSVILVTSVLCGEGKTGVASHLALSLAKAGHRVALVDGNLVNQNTARWFSMPQGQCGLLDCVKDENRSLEECMRQVPDTSLWLLSGPNCARYRYSIDSKGMERVLEQLREKYDYVVMDSSACMVTTETALMCHYAGTVLLVVRHGYAGTDQILDTVDELRRRNVNIAGMVYNET